MRARRWRRIAATVGLITSTIILMMWVASLCWTFSLMQRLGFRSTDTLETRPAVGLFLEGGTVVAAYYEPGAGLQAWSDYGIESTFQKPDWWPLAAKYSENGCHFRMLALWFPFLLVAIPTAFLWWRGRRIPPGHCRKCGYNLTGKVSGICPECGRGRDVEDEEVCPQIDTDDMDAEGEGRRGE